MADLCPLPACSFGVRRTSPARGYKRKVNKHPSVTGWASTLKVCRQAGSGDARPGAHCPPPCRHPPVEIKRVHWPLAGSGFRVNTRKYRDKGGAARVGHARRRRWPLHQALTPRWSSDLSQGTWPLSLYVVEPISPVLPSPPVVPPGPPGLTCLGATCHPPTALHNTHPT